MVGNILKNHFDFLILFFRFGMYLYVSVYTYVCTGAYILRYFPKRNKYFTSQRLLKALWALNSFLMLHLSEYPSLTQSYRILFGHVQFSTLFLSLFTCLLSLTSSLLGESPINCKATK